MAYVLKLVPWLLMVVVVTSAQKSFKQITGLKSHCLGNIIRVTLDKSLAIGGRLEVDVVNGSQFTPITPNLASQCGYSMESDPWGNTKIFASVLSCYTNNQDDEVFDLGVRLRMYGEHKSDEDVHQATKTCNYNQWAAREILCERNYMEVSINRLPPPIDPAFDEPKLEDSQWPGAVPDAVTSEANIWRMVFFTPKEKSMLLADAQRAGYGVATTPTRLVIRSPYTATETYSENIAGVSMKVLKATTYFKDLWSVTMLDTAAACPTDGVFFTEETITWYVPRHIYPLLASTTSETMEVHMGVDGERLSESQRASRGYTMSITDSHFVVELPVGGPDGYYKSHAPQYQYKISYSIEAMIEVVWAEADSEQLTRYKVLYPITTPMMPRPPHVFDNTVPEERVFDVLLGTFLHDVTLMNMTFATGVLTVAEANARGFNVQEHRFPNGSKTYSLQVPFSDPVVLKTNPEREFTTYTLPLVFGLVVLPEQSPFSHPALLETTLHDVVLPEVTGTCDDEHYYIIMTYGSQGSDVKVIVGKRELTSDLAKEYSVRENATHLTMRVPFSSSDAVFTFVLPSAVGGRLDLKVIDLINQWSLNDFSLACTFPMRLTECSINGTITALAVKVESVPNLIPSQLTLRDQSCKPIFSNDRLASFSFPVNSCGTTRTFVDGFMVYQNEITMSNQGGGKGGKTASSPEYRFSISCYYVNDDLKMLQFLPLEPVYDVPQPGFGEMRVQMRMATDVSYNVFLTEEEYPVVEYLKHPLYFEVELMDSTDPQLELFLESCWATMAEDRLSTPQWDIIVDGCPNHNDGYLTTLHPVMADSRVQFPSHFKRFDVKMFAFVQDNLVLKNQIFIHCDAAICDNNKQSDGLCYRRCPSYPGEVNHEMNSIESGQSSAKFTPRSRTHLSSGRIQMSQPRYGLQK